MYFFPQYAVVICKFSRWSHILAAVPSSSFPGGEKTEPPQSTVCAAMHFQGKAPQFLFRLGKPLLISAGAYSSCPSKAAAHRGLKTATLWWLCVFLQWQLRSKLSGTIILFLYPPISPFSLTLQQCSHFRGRSNKHKEFSCTANTPLALWLEDFYHGKEREKFLWAVTGHTQWSAAAACACTGHLHHSSPFMGCLRMWLRKDSLSTDCDSSW